MYLHSVSVEKKKISFFINKTETQNVLKYSILSGNGKIQDSVYVKEVQTEGTKESPCVSTPGGTLCD